MESWVLNPGILSRACFPDNQDQNPMQIPNFFSRSLSPVNPHHKMAFPPKFACVCDDLPLMSYFTHILCLICGSEDQVLVFMSP